MPIYVYKAISEQAGCEYCLNTFEIMQSMSDNALEVCPECKNPVRRVIQPVGMSIGKKWMLSDKNIKKKGFTKLVNEGDGKFRKI